MILRDLRFAMRSLRKSPGFAAVAVLSLGLGLGLVTTMFALLDAVRHPYVPYRDPDRLYTVGWRYYGKLRIKAFDVFEAVRDRTNSFEAVVPLAFNFGVSIEVGGELKEVNAAQVPGRFFSLLGVRTRLGRTLTDTDAGRDVAVVSDELWRRGFSGRRSLRGAAIAMGPRLFAVVGVMPRGMSYPFDAAVWVPMSDETERSGAGLEFRFLRPLVKLKPGVSEAQGDTDLVALARFLSEKYGVTGSPFQIGMGSIRADPMRLGEIHYAMVGAALAVLLIACANLANLMLARGLSKRREVALRLAVGASRSAVVWQMFAETVVLTFAGAALGAVASVWGAHIVTSRVPEHIWFLGIVEPQLSWRVFALAALAAAGSAVAFGLIPAIRVANAVSLDEPLKDGAGTTGRLRQRYSLLAVSEVALALALLMGAGLLLRVVHRLTTYDYNFPARQLLDGWVWTPGADSVGPAERVRFQLAAIAALRRVEGVADAAGVSYPMTPGGAVVAELTADSNRMYITLTFPVVTPGYLRTMQLPVLEGRDFVEGDLVGNGAVILNTVAAARMYPHETAVGHMLKLGGPASSAPWVRIVGICRTALKLADPNDLTSGEAGPEVYVVRAASTGARMRLLVRAARDPAKLAVAVTRALRGLGPRVNANTYPYLYRYSDAVATRSFLAQLFVTMGSFALVLAAIGIYGVLAYAVSRRIREFAVRIALGAQRADLLKSVLHDGLVMTLAGTGLGAFVALWSSYLLENLLEDIPPTDALTLVLAEGVLLGVTIAACLAPAFRAMRADPIEILRAT